DLHALLGREQMVEVLGGLTDVDLHPVDRAVEDALAGVVVVADGRGRVASDVGGLVAREHERHGRADPALADGLTVDVQGDGSTLARAAAVVGELHPYLMPSVGYDAVRDDLEALQPDEVVAVAERAVFRIERPAAEGTALRDDHAAGPARRHDHLG